MAIAEWKRSGWRDIAMLGLSLTVCFGVAGLGASWTSMGLGPWYQGLKRPAWGPPNYLFAPVWTTLYTLMAIAAWLVWRARGWSGAKVPLSLYALQLALNLAWPGIFFAMRMPGPAFVEIVLMWLAILATILAFARVHRTAAWLLVPYLAWVTFASCLNFAIWRLNP